MSKGKEQDLKDLKAALALTLHHLLTLPPPPAVPSPPIPTSTSAPDFFSLLHLLKAHTTTLSLSLGKQPPTPHAALPYLVKLSDDFAKLRFLVTSLSPSCTLLAKEWGWRRDEVRDGLVALVRGFEADVYGVKEGRKSGWEKEYLVRVGVVYSVVERAVGTKGGLSRTEREAVGKRWKDEGEGLADGEREGREMLEDKDEDNDGSEGEESEEDEEYDGWEGLMGGKVATKIPEEKEVVKKILPLLRLPILLHNHILTAHLPKPTPLLHLHSLLPLSTALLTAQDDLVSSLYSSPLPPPAELKEFIDDLVFAQLKLKSAVAEELDRAETSEGVEKRRKWLGVWEGMVERGWKEVNAALQVYGESSEGLEKAMEKLEVV